MNVDRLFIRKLHVIDKNLGCFFNRKIMKYVITYRRATGDPVPVMTCAGMENGVFRQPNDVDIETLRAGDTVNTRLHDRMLRVSKHMEAERERYRRKTREMIRERTIDDKIQLQRAFAAPLQAGKGNATFRRVNVKPKQRGLVTAANA